MNTYITTTIMEMEGHLNNVVWNRCIPDALERYRAETGQDVQRVRFCVRGEEADE